MIEARAVARLTHPNIVSIHSVSNADGRLYYAMDFVEGGSLRARIRELPRMPLRQAVQLVQDVASAIHYAHTRGVIHRDLKPENILLTPEGSPKVADFGLAKVLDSDHALTEQQVVMGTLAYMSPEQSTDFANVTFATDIYALGAILYELITGVPPIAVLGNPLNFIARLQKEDPTPPVREAEFVHLDLQSICLKCLAKEPERRYETAGTLAHDLDCFLEGRPVMARAVGPISKIWLLCRRNRTVASLTAAVIVVLATGLIVALVQLQQTRSALVAAHGQAMVARTAINDFFVQIYDNDAFRQPGLKEIREDLVGQAETMEDKIDHTLLGPAINRDDQRVIAIRNFVRGLAQAETPDGTNDAIQSFGLAKDGLTELLQTSNLDDRAALESLSDVWVAIGRLRQTQAGPDPLEAKKAYEESRVIRERLWSRNRTDANLSRKLASVLMNLATLSMDSREGDVENREQAFDEAESLLKQSQSIRGGVTSRSAALLRDEARTLFDLGQLCSDHARLNDAVMYYKTAEELCLESLDRKPWDIDMHVILAKSIYGQLDDSQSDRFALLSKAATSCVLATSMEPKNRDYIYLSAMVHTEYARFMLVRNRPDAISGLDAAANALKTATACFVTLSLDSQWDYDALLTDPVFTEHVKSLGKVSSKSQASAQINIDSLRSAADQAHRDHLIAWIEDDLSRSLQCLRLHVLWDEDPFEAVSVIDSVQVSLREAEERRLAGDLDLEGLLSGFESCLKSIEDIVSSRAPLANVNAPSKELIQADNKLGIKCPSWFQI